MNDRFKFRFWNKSRKAYENTYDLKCCEHLDYVVPEQCTGLKDKNGKLIYEGDIVHSPLDKGTTKVIFWNDGLARFMAYDGKDKRFTQDIGDCYFIELDFEVIGNIHENKELLDE